MEGQEGISWSPSFLKAPSEQELEQRTEPWDKSRRPWVSPSPSLVLFYNLKQVMALLWATTSIGIINDSRLTLLSTR